MTTSCACQDHLVHHRRRVHGEILHLKLLCMKADVDVTTMHQSPMLVCMPLQRWLASSQAMLAVGEASEEMDWAPRELLVGVPAKASSTLRILVALPSCFANDLIIIPHLQWSSPFHFSVCMLLAGPGSSLPLQAQC